MWHLRELTLTQPWAGLVAAGIKRVENRPRAMIKRSDFCQLFAIHASRDIDERVYDRVFDIAPELGGGIRAARHERWLELSRITSAVIGVARIDKVLDGGWDADSIARHADALSFSDGSLLGEAQVRWFFGPVGYLTRDVQALAVPVPCRGHLGFWTLPPGIERAVNAQLTRET